MSKKVIMVQASVAEKIRDALDSQEGAWDEFDLVIIPDGDLEQASKLIEESMPVGKRLRSVDIEDFIK